MKDFLLITNKNVVIYKEIFPLIKEGKVRLGCEKPGDFDQPEGDDYKCMKGLTRWLTTLPAQDRPRLKLTKRYDPKLYPKYDNYDAINVNKLKDIPIDYDGVMGVPLTFFDYHPDGFEIVGRGGDIAWAEADCSFYTPPTKEKADEYKKQDGTWRIQNPYLMIDGKPYTPYNRLFIQPTFSVVWQASGNSYANAPKEIMEELAFDPSQKYGGGLGTCILDGKATYTRIMIKRITN